MKERKLNIDILKCIAIVFVVAVHFFFIPIIMDVPIPLKVFFYHLLFG